MAETNDDMTESTKGGMSFEQLCRGGLAPYYVCDKECLVHDITDEDTLETAEKKLVEKIEKLFLEIQIQKDVRINKFYIGKTYIRKTENAKKLDKLNPNTWKKKGIRDRWDDHKANDYGKDGMIVIAVITRLQVPQIEGGKTVVHQELYTLALEQRLLHHYKITKPDARLENKTFTSGGTDNEKSAGYALYVAFSCIENTDEEEVEENNELPFPGQPLEDPTAGKISNDDLESTIEQKEQLSANITKKKTATKKNKK